MRRSVVWWTITKYFGAIACVLLINLFVVLVIPPVAQAASTTTVFAQPNGPIGVSTGLDGSVFVTYDGITSSRIAKFATNGAVLAGAETPGDLIQATLAA
jgi:hypothetical protein